MLIIAKHSFAKLKGYFLQVPRKLINLKFKQKAKIV